MTAIITLEIQAPINCSEDEFTEWIRFELYEMANIKASNPLVHENFTSIINSIEINKQKKMETKLNTGAIFKNDKKASDKHPDYRGKINVDGKDKEISLWLNTSEKGTKYFSVKISEVWKPKEGAAGTTVNPVVTNTTEEDSGLSF